MPEAIIGNPQQHITLLDSHGVLLVESGLQIRAHVGRRSVLVLQLVVACAADV